MDNFHIHHKIRVITVLRVAHESSFSGVLHHPVFDKLSLKPGTSELTEFVHISSAKT